MSSVRDLIFFERFNVEYHLEKIIANLYSIPSLRKKYSLKGYLRCDNHAETLGPEEYTRIRADQFCVYNVSSKTNEMSQDTAAFIIQYQAPYQLSLSHIYNGLDDMDLEEVLRRREVESSRDVGRRLLAATITQAFSYMIAAGLEYGYVCTGEAFIFLRVPDDPKTVYYYLSVPMDDVGKTTGLESDSDGENRLHLTAMGQVLAFTLQALKSRPRNQSWRKNALAQLKVWKVVYQDLLDEANSKGFPSLDYRPPRKTDFICQSPVQTRQRPVSTTLPSCHPLHEENKHSDNESSPNLDTPNRDYQQPKAQCLTQAPGPVNKASSPQKSYNQGKALQYCTQKCLLGLVEGGLLDKMCPNAQDHGKGRHKIDQHMFLALLQQQLSESYDIDCDPMGLYGARGALFTVRLRSHGYTLAAKCTTVDFVSKLKWEAVIYQRLRPIQGFHVPVYLGSLDLDYPYYLGGFAVIVHMMFMSYGGQCILSHINADNRPTLVQKVKHSIQAVHQLGVLHHDAESHNVLWDADVGEAMIIDFERAEILERRAPLGDISSNRKRKREPQSKEQKTQPMDQPIDTFYGEELLLLNELGAS